MIPFDGYTWKARIAPALLVLLPLAVVSFAWLPSFEQPWLMLILAPCGIGAFVAVAVETRSAGQAVQLVLFEKWGGPPTTILLRHADPTLTMADKARYHQILNVQCPGIAMPTQSDEARDPRGADSIYESAVNWLRAQTRDAKRFPTVSDENANYGFHRNMRGVRGLGFSAASVGVLGAGVLAVLEGITGLRVPTAFVVSVGCFICFWAAASEPAVRTAAWNYAKTLLSAIDGLTARK